MEWLGGRLEFAASMARAGALVAGAASLALLLGLGCGQGNSSGGQVLRATGFFSEVGDTETAPTATSNMPDSGRTVSFSQTVSIPNDPDNDLDFDGGYIGLVNTQGSALITTTGAKLVYTIQGSSFSVPNDFFAFSIQVPASSGATPVFAQIQLVSAATMSFLQSNAGALPPPPFSITVSVTVRGQSQAGTTFTSNALSYSITFTD